MQLKFLPLLKTPCFENVSLHILQWDKQMPTINVTMQSVPRKLYHVLLLEFFLLLKFVMAFAYPIAGYVGIHFQSREFLIGAGISLGLFVLIIILLYPRPVKKGNNKNNFAD